MKIMYGITKGDIGGAQSHVIQLINHYANEHDVYLLVGNNGPMLQQLDKRVKVIIINNLVGPINLKKDLLATREVMMYISRIKPDILHLHSSKAGIIGRIANKFSDHCNPYVIFTAHSWAFTEDIPMIKRNIFKWIEKMAYSLTDKVICVSEYDSKVALDAGFKSNKLVTIHNSLEESQNTTYTKENKNINKNTVNFVMVARFAYPKMQLQVVDAIKQLNITHKNKFKFCFIGNGETLKQCKEKVEKLHLQATIEFLENVNNAREIIEHYDVFVLMSKQEGLPISILEAMAKGLPIIASNVGGINELIDDNGELIKQNNSKELTKLMRKYIDFERIRKKGELSKVIYQNRFNPKIMFEKLDEIYGNVQEKG